MATRLQFRKFSTTSIATLVGANGELYVDTTKKTIVVQDGATTGGSTLATESWVSSALGTVSFNTSVLNGYALSSALTSYTTNANLTSTLAGYALSSSLTSYTTNANLTSTLAGYALSSSLSSYTTNANLTSTLASFTVSKLQYSSLTVQLDSAGSVTFSTDSKIRNGYPGSYGSSNDGSSWFVTPPSQPGGVASANGEQYIQINNGVHVEIGTNYTSSSGYAWLFDQNGNTIFPTGVTHSSSGSGVKFSSGYDKSFQIETTTTSTSKLWNFTAQGNLTLPQGGDILNSSGNSVLGGSTFDSSSLTSYTTNANLTSTLSSYVLSSALTSYTTNANLTSTLAQYALSSTLTSYTTNANLTSTLTNYTTNANLTSTLASYTTNANLTSTLANYTTNANLTSTLATYVPTTSLLTVTTLTANTITVTNSSNATTTANGALILYGGLSVNRDIFLAGTSTLKIGTGTMSITQDGITRANGAMTLRAGGGGSNIGSMYFTNNYGVQIWGGSAVANQPAFNAYGIRLANRDGNVSVSDSSDSTSISTGSFVVTGGVGISKRLNVGGQALVSSLSVSNNAIISGFLTLPNRPAFRVIGNSSTNHTETSNGIGILTGNNYTVDYNQGSYLNTSTGVFTAPISGLYHITLNARTSSFNNATSQLICYDNYSSTATVALMWESTASGTATHFGVSTIASLTSGDALVIKVGAGTINFDGSDSWAVAFIG